MAAGSSASKPIDQAGDTAKDSTGGSGGSGSGEGGNATSSGGAGGTGAAATGGSGGEAGTMPDPPPTGGTDVVPEPPEPDAGPKEDAAVDAGPPPEPEETFFRVTEFYVRDPHFYLLGTTDITDTPWLGTSVNGTMIPGGLTMDYDFDGFVDVSILIGLKPADPATPSGALRMMDARCPITNLTSCMAHESPGLDATWEVDNTDDACLGTIAGTATSFDATGVLPSGPCFVTRSGQAVVLDVSGIRLEMVEAQVSATYQGSGPDSLAKGLIRGFVTLSSATTAQIPDYVPLLAGSPLADYLLSDERDMTESPTGEDGWWVYLNFVAKPVEYTAP